MNCTIENLDERYVTLKVTIDREKVMKTYCNCDYDRKEIERLYEHSVLTRILEVWGTEPTIPDLPDPNPKENE